MKSTKFTSRPENMSCQSKKIITDSCSENSISTASSHTQILPKNNGLTNNTVHFVSKNQVTSNVSIENDINEDFDGKVASSQMEINRFLETRIQSPQNFKNRVLKAYKKTEKQYKDMLIKEAEQDIDITV